MIVFACASVFKPASATILIPLLALLGSPPMSALAPLSVDKRTSGAPHSGYLAL
jgi:hypothetical protein